MQVLQRFPRIGPARSDIRKGLRMLVEGNYLILYEFDTRRDEVEIVAIVEAAAIERLVLNKLGHRTARTPMW